MGRRIKQIPYGDLGFGPHFVEEPYVSLTNGNGGYRPDAIWGKARVLLEDKRSVSSRTLHTARTEVTAYFAELWRAQKPDRKEQWLGVATNRHSQFWARDFRECRPVSPWRRLELADLPNEAPGPLDVPMTDQDLLLWSAGNIHLDRDGVVVRLCTSCGHDKQISSYYSATNRAGSRSICRTCTNTTRWM